MADIKRKLATIQTIKEVAPIEGADLIDKITFESMNWVCVMAKKDLPSKGMKVVFFEIDSVLDKENPVFAFMEKYNYRIKTVKFRQQISQGLALPVTFFSDVLTLGDIEEDGNDVTDKLKIVKYEIPEEFLPSEAKGNFPSFIVKTDEERAANIKNLDEILATHRLSATIKIDGTSSTFYSFDGRTGICSRNLELKPSDSTYWKINEKHGIIDRLTAMGGHYAMQGEIAGVGVNGNRAKLTDIRFFAFTVQDLNTGKRLNPTEFFEFIYKMNSLFTDKEEIKTVPVLGGFEPGHFKGIGDLMVFSDGTNVINQTTREGVVLRSLDDDNVSFKMINPKYLLKHDL